MGLLVYKISDYRTTHEREQYRILCNHLKNIYESGEVSQDSTCANFAQVADNGKTYQYKFYNVCCNLI
mgnify:CR=1 FL=1